MELTCLKREATKLKMGYDILIKVCGGKYIMNCRETLLGNRLLTLDTSCLSRKQ